MGLFADCLVCFTSSGHNGRANVYSREPFFPYRALCGWELIFSRRPQFNLGYAISDILSIYLKLTRFHSPIYFW